LYTGSNITISRNIKSFNVSIVNPFNLNGLTNELPNDQNQNKPTNDFDQTKLPISTHPNYWLISTSSHMILKNL
jgi:hypothetical protein